MTIKNKLLCLLLIICGNSYAQEFKVKAALNTVGSTGFYKIPVTPELSAYAKADLSDIRIAADSNVYVPYMMMDNAKVHRQDSLTNCTIVSNTSDSNYTSVVLTNPTDSGLTTLSLVISNTSVERTTQLSGSDDNVHWYVIDDNMHFDRADANNNGSYTQTLQFPLSKYKYFKLKINNQKSDPIRIVGAGTFKSIDNAAPGYVNNPAPDIMQKDSSNHNSYIVIKNTAGYLTGRVTLRIAGPQFYERTAVAYVLRDKKDSSGINEPVANFTVSSKKECSFSIASQKAYTIIVEIDNKDNPPLKVTGATTAQEQQYLIAWLEKDKSYSLLAGSDSAAAPQYDIAQFKDKIPADIQELHYGQITSVPKLVKITTAVKNYWLWPTIIIAVILLSFLTYRLMKDMKMSGTA